VRKTIGLPVLALVLAALGALAPAAARSATGDTNGPSCRDITNGQFNYTQTSFNQTGPNTFNLNGQLLLGDAGTTAPCKQVTYTLYVIIDGSDPATATAYPPDPDALLTGNVQWTGISITDDDPNICVYATTSHNGKVFDTAPDTGCLVVTAGTTGGGGGFN
jgi:hypothetical protein